MAKARARRHVQATPGKVRPPLQSPRTFRTRSYPLSFSGGNQLAHTQDEKDRLKKMGVMTALAIGLHNFPEGMAAFVATLSATSLGLAVTFAVAIHNIPVRPLRHLTPISQTPYAAPSVQEGVCVSMPLYYATGSKKKAFFWAFVSGISEPIGAVVCYLVFFDGAAHTAHAHASTRVAVLISFLVYLLACVQGSTLLCTACCLG